MLTTLEQAKRAGATIVAINPLRERALERFQAACYAGDDDAAESARNELVGCVEQFTDHFAAAHRRMRDPV